MKRDFEIYQGVTLSFTAVVRDDSGARIDVTGLTGTAITWKLAPKSLDGTPAETPDLTLSIGSGIVLTTPAQGLVTVTVTNTQTAALISGHYVHELKATKSGVTYLPLYGSAVVSRDLS